MTLDRDAVLHRLGGDAAVAAMPDEEKADALDRFLLERLNTYPPAAGAGTSPRFGSRTLRRGSGRVFGDGETEPPALLPMPPRPTLLDFLRLRFDLPLVRHSLMSAKQALDTGASEEQILACMLHDLGQALAKVDHGWWGAQLIEPYVPERTAFAVRYHQALRFYPDEAAGYEYPELYVQIFGKDYVPEPYIAEAYELARKHPWYMDARVVTVCDLYAFDPDKEVVLEPFVDIVGRHFRQPEEGLGFDGSPVAHMWRSIIFPDHPL